MFYLCGINNKIMGKKIKIELTAEEIYLKNKTTSVKAIQEDFIRVGKSPNDRKKFVIGEKVYITNGGFISGEIIDIIEEDIYGVEVIYETNKSYSSETHILTRKRICGWYDVFKLAKETCDINIGENLRLNFMQQEIDSLVRTYIISFGVDFNPSYQRGLVWSNEDEEKLIESIFARVDIGKFVFIHLGYSSDIMYEVLDGKQRLTTLYRYFTDEFKYKGYYYSELPLKYKHIFGGTAVAVAVTNKESLKEEDILNYFLRLNTTGKPMDIEHLNKIRDRYENIIK
jgi:hypothetical protein